VVEVSRVTVLFRYEISCGARALCSGDTTLVSVGDDMKIKRIPDDVAAVFLSAEKPPSEWAPRASG
jgi:hypothetical protein